MKKIMQLLVPLLVAAGIIASIGWYLLVYDREFTRDTLLSQARFFDTRGNVEFASFLYDLAYDYTGQDDEVAIELANQYKADGNYTKAEYTLTNAIADGGTVDLYIALCKTYVEQDKLMDAVNMLDHISDPALKAKLDELRPEAPAPDHNPGFYNEYITVNMSYQGKTLYCSADGEYPSIGQDIYNGGITLPGGETSIYAVSVAENGLVSPLTIAAYTVGGVIEEVNFADPAFEDAIRNLLGMDEDHILMTDELWVITEFTVPADAAVFTDLQYLPYLEKLTMEGHQLDSLNVLSSLANLREIHFSNCRFPADDLSIIARMPYLQKLTLSNCGLSTIAALSNAQSLVYLDLSNNTLRNLEPLSGMATLKELYLQHNAVTGLDALCSLAELTRLDISYNSVTDLSTLPQCQKLTWLNAGHNSISDLTGVENFTVLTHLDLDHNQLSDITILGDCITLTELNVSNNQLKSITALGKLSALTTLDFSYNQVKELPTWPDGSALSILNGSYNEIASVYPLRNLENLTYVYLDYNKLTTVDPIADCYRLVIVNVYGNNIKDVSKLTAHNIIVNYNPT